jgi:membrane protease YdiL (CAAX protease family)
MMLTTKLQKIQDVWWFRILIFCSISILLFYSLLNYGNTFIIDNFTLIIFIGFLAISTLSEFYRENSRWYFFGYFNVLKQDQLGNHFLLLLTSIANTLILVFICLAFCKSIVVSKPLLSNLITSIFSFLLIVSIEEIFFRGIIFQAIEDRFGSTISIILTSLAFATAHYFNPYFSIIAFINTFMAGILFAIIFILTRSIILSTIFHFYWNFFLALFIGSPVSGLMENTNIIFFTNSSIPRILSGGLYGFEGGIIVTFILFFNILFLSKSLYLSPFISSKLLIRDFSSISNTHKKTISSSHLFN